MKQALRHLVIVLGDQLSEEALALEDFDPQQDAIWMAEVDEESTRIRSSKQRTTLFLSAMRHFAQRLTDKAWPVLYSKIDDPSNTGTLSGELEKAARLYTPQKLLLTAPGDWTVLQNLRACAAQLGLELVLLDDRHFLCTVRDFKAHAQNRKQLRLEYFYREMRLKTGILMEGKKPVGGQWNFDHDNRGSFGKTGPQHIPPPSRFGPDQITQEVMEVVNQRFAQHPGRNESFQWPVTREEALKALSDFIAHRLPEFGQYQDAMWRGEVWLYHSHIASALNLKLLNPLEVLLAAQEAYNKGLAPLAAVEGFVRQILGWREYVRGIYWTHMPDYAELNTSNANAALPSFYWTGKTEMACLKDAIEQTLEHGYAHHIQRLMVTGLYALLLGVEPKAVHEWYLGVYVDAVEWVELPNTLGMSQFADGGLMASKPYVASGKYIDRMSNYCKGCRFDPAKSTGPDACPFTTLYWHYLIKHKDSLAKNPRMLMQIKNVNRLSESAQQEIAQQAQSHLRTSDE
jgi:deoxyribodipyrimidine photolyase-related protein